MRVGSRGCFLAPSSDLAAALLPSAFPPPRPFSSLFTLFSRSGRRAVPRRWWGSTVARCREQPLTLPPAHRSRPAGAGRGRGARLKLGGGGAAVPSCCRPAWRRPAWSGCWARCSSWCRGARRGPWCSAAWFPTCPSTATSGGRRTPRASPPTCAWCCWWRTSCGYCSGEWGCALRGVPPRLLPACRLASS